MGQVCLERQAVAWLEQVAFLLEGVDQPPVQAVHELVPGMDDGVRSAGGKRLQADQQQATSTGGDALAQIIQHSVVKISASSVVIFLVNDILLGSTRNEEGGDRRLQRLGDLLERADARRCLAILDQAEGVDVQTTHLCQRADCQLSGSTKLAQPASNI